MTFTSACVCTIFLHNNLLHLGSIIVIMTFTSACVCNIFLRNNLLLCHDYPSLSSNFYHQGKNNQFNHILLCHDYPCLSSNFYHQGKTTTNLISYFCVMITDVLVQTFNTRGKYKWRNSSSIPTRTRWRLAPLKF